MKTLIYATRLSLILILLTAFNACKKNDDNNPGGGAGSYTYAGNTTATTRGDYLLTGGDTYVFVYGTGATDIVQIIFSKLGNITEGTYTYKPTGNGYNSASNFSGGSVTTAAHPEGTVITGGTVNVTKTANGYSISFDCTTAGGSLKGSYSGAFTSR